MPNNPKPSARIRRVGLGLALSTVCVGAWAGLSAFRQITARTGEAALSLVPSDALAVASIDLSPSASQILAFKHIDDSLQRNGMSELVGSGIADLFEPHAPGKEGLRPLLTRHGALVLLASADGKLEQSKPVGLVAVTSGADALTALQKGGVTRYYKGFRYYKLKNGQQLYAVFDNVLAIAGEPESLYAIYQTKSGQKAPITTVADFQSARTQLADDANLMVFASPRVFNSLPSEVQYRANGWISMGMAIREGGIGMTYAGASDMSAMPGLAKFGEIAPVRSDLFKVLPSGAYGTIAMSQPTKMFEGFEDAILTGVDAKKGLRDMEDSMAKETGMSLRKDVLPAFRGNSIFAAYPSEAPTAGVDGLVVIDDLQGATPADAADRFMDWVARQMEKEGGQPIPWTKRVDGDVTYFRINDKVEGDMKKNLFGGPEGRTKQVLSQDKTVAWAFVGKTVLLATSQKLLDRAIVAYRTKTDTLATDPKLGRIESEVTNGSQQIGAFSVARIAEGIQNTVEKRDLDEPQAKPWRSLLAAFTKLDEPLRFHARMFPDGRFTGGTFIPMDYDKMIDLAGEMRQK